MGGKLDGSNTFTKLYDVQLWSSRAVRVFEPMISVSMQNNDSVRIIAPRLIFNDRGNWYDPESMASEAVRGALTGPDTILSLMYFVYNNRSSYMLPNIDSYYGLKMLPIYGYGSCDLTSYSVRLLSNALGLAQRPFVMPHHVVSSAIIGGKDFHIDADFRVFYLLNDNETLAGIDEILHDKHLIRRTKHFGENIIYHKGQDDYISRIYYADYDGLLKGVNPALFNNYFDYQLRPSETISFSWEEPDFYHQSWGGYDTVPGFFLSTIIANGTFELGNGFGKYDPEEIFDTIFGLEYVKNENGSALLAQDKGVSRAEILYESPFPIHSVIFDANFVLTDVQDSIEIFFNLIDSDTITSKIGVIKEPGQTTFLSDLSYLLMTSEYRQVMPFAYKYQITMLFNKTADSSSLGLDSIYLRNTFQISRKFMPSLDCGINSISYRDSGEQSSRDLFVNINWQESYDNSPPSPPQVPLFPSDRIVVDSLYFEFAWPAAEDEDGDRITDYEFFLSNREDMRFPLSPNFSQYVSAFNSGIDTKFKVKETGWLNDGEEYFWRVRAKDSRGAWGNWSPVWSFIPHGVMHPLNLKVQSSADGIWLTWQRNATGKEPDYYKIYGSNESEGFSPSSDNLIGTVPDTAFQMILSSVQDIYSFYRVAACTDDGQESQPSEYAKLQGPDIFFSTDSVRPFQGFSARIYFNEIQRVQFYYKYDTIDYRPSYDVNKLPDWLSVDEKGNITGFATEKVSREMVFGKMPSIIDITVSDTSGMIENITLELFTTAKNNRPLPIISETKFRSNQLLELFITTSDGDHLYGDAHTYSILNVPIWLSSYQRNDSLFFYGVPLTEDAGLHELDIMVSDSKNASSSDVFQLMIYEMGKEVIKILPNPVKEYATIVLFHDEKTEVELSVLSLTGVSVADIYNSFLEPGSSYIDLNLSSLPPGIYILNAKFKSIDDGKVQNIYQRFVKL